MTELLERALVTQAPDLWHWRSRVFYLRTRAKPGPSPLEVDGKRLPSGDYRLHPEHRLQRLEEDLAPYRKAGDRFGEMNVINGIGIALLEAGDARLAKQDFEEVLRIARELRRPDWEGAALGNLGNAHAESGDTRKSIEFSEHSRAIAREIGDRRGEGTAQSNLG